MFGRLPERGSEIPICPRCQSHRVQGWSRRRDNGEHFMAWVCNACDHKFEIIAVESVDNSLAGRRARKRPGHRGGR